MSLQDQEVVNKEKYEQLIKELEFEINQLKCAERTPMLVNCDHEEEINQLQVIRNFILILCLQAIFSSFQVHVSLPFSSDAIGFWKTKLLEVGRRFVGKSKSNTSTTSCRKQASSKTC